MNTIEKLRATIASWRKPVPVSCAYSREWSDGNNVGRENCADEVAALLPWLEGSLEGTSGGGYVAKYQVEVFLLWPRSGLSGEPPPISTSEAVRTIQALAKCLLNLENKLALIDNPLSAICLIAQLHGRPYVGPTWDDERNAAVDLLRKLGWMPEDK